MGTEKVVIDKNVFPKYWEWSTIIASHNLKNNYIEDLAHSSFGYKNQKGIANSLVFPSSFKKEDHSSVITQDYKIFTSELDVRIHSILRENYLNAELRLTPLMSPYVDYISIISQSLLPTPVYEDSLTEWEKKQTVILYLKNEYLNKLKEKDMIPGYFTNKIYITPDKSTGKLIAESEESNVESPIFITEDLLKSFFEDFGFSFNIKPNENITDGTFGDMNFILRHINHLSINRDDVWNTLTENDPERPLIFPVSIFSS